MNLKTLILEYMEIRQDDCHSIELSEHGAAVTAFSLIDNAPSKDGEKAVIAGARINASNWPPPTVACSWAQLLQAYADQHKVHAYIKGARDALRFRNT